eukprot:COSAG01_NODE_9478_length_2436_cov_1.160890_1_plen_229_part_10
MLCLPYIAPLRLCCRVGRRFYVGEAPTIHSRHITRAALIRDDGCGLYGFGHPQLPSHMFSEWMCVAVTGTVARSWSVSICICRADPSVARRRRGVLKQVHPDTEIGATALAVANDYCSDLLVRIVGKGAGLPVPTVSLDGDWDRLQDLGSGSSEFENVRNLRVVQAPVACSGDGDDRVEATLLVLDEAVAQASAVGGEAFAALPEGPDAALICSVRCLTSRDIQTAVRS